MINEALSDARERMQGAIRSLEEDLGAIRTGRASPALVERLQVEYYGAPTPLIQLASISVPEPRSLMIKPFDPSTIKAIERAIQSSDLGLTPNNDGKNIHLNLPVPTEERRRELVRVVQRRVEEGKVAIRNVRRDTIRDLREFEDEKLISENELGRGEDDVQKLTDEFIEKMVDIGKQKEQEVLEI
jgi:ribosome recycling factor